MHIYIYIIHILRTDLCMCGCQRLPYASHRARKTKQLMQLGGGDEKSTGLRIWIFNILGQERSSQRNKVLSTPWYYSDPQWIRWYPFTLMKANCLCYPPDSNANLFHRHHLYILILVKLTAHTNQHACFPQLSLSLTFHYFTVLHHHSC